jgi:hypothetical protein
MEADWSVEIGADFPWIDATSPAFLDLRISPHAIDTLPEPAQHSALRDALLALNAPASPLCTSKCDTWSLTGNEIDPDEFSASPQDAATGFASYIDILNRDPDRFSSFALAEQHVRELAACLRQVDLTCSRIDFVVRGATARYPGSATTDGYGITLYVAACGTDQAAAYTVWQTALAAAVAATIAVTGSRTGE